MREQKNFWQKTGHYVGNVREIIEKKKHVIIVGCIILLCIGGAGVWLGVQNRGLQDISGDRKAQGAEATSTADTVSGTAIAEAEPNAGTDAGQSETAMDTTAGTSSETDNAVTAPLQWQCTDVMGVEGENAYTDILLGAEYTYGEAPAYLTFADEDSRIAYIIAGTAAAPDEAGVFRGSLWRVSGDDGGRAELILLDMVLESLKVQYLDFDGVKYLFLNYVEDEREKGKIQAFSLEEPELLASVPGHKYALEDGIIECENSSYAFCKVTTDAQGQKAYDWAEGDKLIHTYQCSGDGKLREVGSQELTEEELKEYSFGESVLRQVAEKYPRGMKQYILRDNDRLNVNIGVEEENQISFFYMTFFIGEMKEVAEAAGLLSAGKGCYLTRLTGEASRKAFVEAFGGDGHVLPGDTAILPWQEEALLDAQYLRDRKVIPAEQSYIYGGVTTLSAEEKAVLDGILLDCSNTWEKRPWYTENMTNGQYNDKYRQIYIVQKSDNFMVYGSGISARLLVRTPDSQYVLIDSYFTSNYGVQPEVLEHDFDGDGEAELAIKGLTEHGTGVCVEFLYMVDKGTDGHWRVYRVAHEWYREQLMSHIDSAYTEQGLELVFDGEPVGYLAEVYGDAASEYSAGSQIGYVFRENKIILVADLMIYSDTQFAGLSYGDELHMTLEYKGDGKWEEADCVYVVDEDVRRYAEAP